MAKTYRELLEFLNKYPDRLDDTVTVLDVIDGEYYPLHEINVTTEKDDVLDEGHIVLVM
jgi:hypothetical protein